MLQKIENTLVAIIFGAIPIITCFLAGWWISMFFVSESQIPFYALGGILLGLIADVIFLKRLAQRAYSLKLWMWISVYVFYSIMLLGFFMGFPVFNAALALPAGVFVGRWLVHINADSVRMKNVTRQSAIFTTGILGIVCVSSAVIALASPSTASDVQGLLGLPFQVTSAMIIGIILVGGAVILTLEWWLTKISIKYAYEYFVRGDKFLGGG